MLDGTFKSFLAHWYWKDLDRDATWRGYDIPAFVKPRHTWDALKALSLAYAGELALSQCMSLYGLTDPAEAEDILACWWVWKNLSESKYIGPVPKRVTSR